MMIWEEYEDKFKAKSSVCDKYFIIKSVEYDGDKFWHISDSEIAYASHHFVSIEDAKKYCHHLDQKDIEWDRANLTTSTY